MDGIAVTLLMFAIFIFSIIVHEVAHAWMADKFGDSTARMLGRITLDPIPHIDLMWSIVIPLIFYFSTGMIFGGAKPVPINPRNFTNLRKGDFWVSFAGPLSNILLACAFAIISRIIYNLDLDVDITHALLKFTIGGVSINLLLAVFNLLPVPPLDGSHIVKSIAPREIVNLMLTLERSQVGIILLVILISSGATDGIIRPSLNFLAQILLVWGPLGLHA